MFGKLGEAKKMAEEMKVKLAAISLEGSAENGKIKVMANGNKEILSVEIAPELLSTDKKEELEDLLVIAIGRALNQANAVSEAEMKAMMGSMMPGLGNLFS
ncbi:MAG: YbaB/EbfC family nucleoid-associated protein [Bacteroidia bacterium]